MASPFSLSKILPGRLEDHFVPSDVLPPDGGSFPGRVTIASEPHLRSRKHRAHFRTSRALAQAILKPSQYAVRRGTAERYR